MLEVLSIMQSMSYKTFIKQVKSRLNNMSKADLDDMIIRWAEKEPSSNDHISSAK